MFQIELEEVVRQEIEDFANAVIGEVIGYLKEGKGGNEMVELLGTVRKMKAFAVYDLEGPPEQPEQEGPHWRRLVNE